MALCRMKLPGALKKLQRSPPASDSPARSPTSTLFFGDETHLCSPAVPADVPKGFFAVYVGDEGKRYVIPLTYLKHHAFLVLLRRAEEEFGFRSAGAIRLPCDTVFFDHLLWLLGREDPSVEKLEMDELLQFYH